jgi:23S rRNA G2445 N2-methylase RlmL
MKVLAMCHEGCEYVTALEAKELVKKKAAIHRSCVEFPVKDVKEAASFAYFSQSSLGVMLLLHQCPLKELEKRAAKVDFDKWLGKETFMVRCVKKNYDGSGQDLESMVGGIIKTKATVDLTNPKHIVLIYIVQDECYIGIDLCGFDISKRDYKIFSTSSSLRGTMAYSIVRLSGYSGKGVLLDPFCGSGTIPIEAAMFSRKVGANAFRAEKFPYSKLVDAQSHPRGEAKIQIYAFDKTFHCVSSAKKNAKIASVHKDVRFSRLDVEWLDTKFDRGSVDFIVADVPRLSKIANCVEVQKIYKEFFYQAEFVLAKNGKIALLSNKGEELIHHASERSFTLESKREVWAGKEKNILLVFKKGI